MLGVQDSPCLHWATCAEGRRRPDVQHFGDLCGFLQVKDVCPGLKGGLGQEAPPTLGRCWHVLRQVPRAQDSCQLLPSHVVPEDMRTGRQMEMRREGCGEEGSWEKRAGNLINYTVHCYQLHKNEIGSH